MLHFVTMEDDTCVATVVTDDGQEQETTISLLLLDNSPKDYVTFIDKVDAGENAKFAYINDDNDESYDFNAFDGVLTISSRIGRHRKAHKSSVKVTITPDVVTSLRTLQAAFEEANAWQEEDDE